jgi:tRNA dimethylallyltransferase
VTRKLIAVVGPTATGKTALGTALSRALDGEIVGADSRQVYRHMDIGTAKPTPDERSMARHHVIDVVDPDQEFSLAQYLELAVEALENLWSRGKQPLLVGGSGQYVWALLEGWRVPRLPPQRELRRELEERAVRQGAEALHRELARVDPKAAARIDPRNVRRVIRALEVHKATGRPISYWQEKEPPPWDVVILGLTWPRQELYERIDARVDAMMQAGLVDEVRGLLAMGYSPSLSSLSGIGYGQVCQYLAGELNLVTAVARIKTATHRLARQQYTWFRLDDERIRWLDVSLDAPFEEATRLVESEPGLGRRVAHGR